MIRASAIAGAVCTTLLVTSAALAQVPPDPNNPNEAVPEKHNYTPYGDTIKLDQAKRVADAALAEANRRGWAMCIAVVAPSGDLVYFERMDNCQYASIQIAQHKARAAARYRVPTVAFERRMAQGPYNAYLPTLDDFIGSRGGNPLVVGGKIIGAIGVSGGSGSQDDTISQAGAKAAQ